jgi:hypothetical protein
MSTEPQAWTMDTVYVASMGDTAMACACADIHALTAARREREAARAALPANIRELTTNLARADDMQATASCALRNAVLAALDTRAKA